jgi:predicted dehydrogenase
MGGTHAAAWSKTPAEIAGFVTKDEPSGAKLIEAYGGRIYSDLAAMLAEVDAIDICAPTHRHHEIALAAAAAGKHVLCEKPLARDLGQAQEMIDACRQAGVKLMVAHVVRFFPEYAGAKAQVDAGAIGRPAVLRFSRGVFQPKKAADNWFVDFRKSGGMMLDLMIHDLDYARWVAGEVESVFAKKISSSHPEAGTDHGLAILKHRSGAISHVEGSWAYPPPIFWTRFEMAGDNGWLNHDSEATAAIDLRLMPAGDESIPDVPLPSNPLDEDPYTTEIKSFYESVVNDAPVAVSGEDGLAALQLALAAIESAESGRAVAITPVGELASGLSG